MNKYEIDRDLLSLTNKNNSLNLHFNYDYISSLSHITWGDILFGIDQNFISFDAGVEHASVLVQKGSPNELVWNILIETDKIDIVELIEQLANEEYIQGDIKNTHDKYMFFVLNWLSDNKNEYPDPLKVLQLVFDDFGRPIGAEFGIEDYSHLQRNFTLSIESIRQQSYEDWIKYLSIQKNKFSPK